MATGATSLSLVRDELFTTMEETETSLEHFIVERNDGSLLQQAVDNLHQVRGTLKLIELAGAELLAQEMLLMATGIPVGAGEDRDGQLGALSNALHVLRRYLEGLDVTRMEMPELLLPAINQLRQAGAQPALPESFFFSVRLDQARPVAATAMSASDADLRRLRHMYQLGLLGFIREENPQAGLKLMLRATTRLDSVFANQSHGRLYWVACAALEAQLEGQLLVTKSRKQLFSKVDREFKQAFAAGESYQVPRNLLKELLYLVALAGTTGPWATEVREAFSLAPLPFTDHLLDEQYRLLSGPGQGVMRSLSSAIREELVAIKDLLDLTERGTVQDDGLVSLHAQMGKLSKTLGMVGLSSAANTLQQQVPVVQAWSIEQPVPPAELQALAESVLYVESMVATLERGEAPVATQAAPGQEGEAFAAHQLLEARIVVVDEAQGGIALAKRAITSYLESNGEKLHLANVPISLQAVSGGLWFLDQPRAAKLVNLCGEYIQRQMIDTTQVPSEQLLETLADALSSLEYYLEGGAALRSETSPSVLDLAEDSVRALGMPVGV